MAVWVLVYGIGWEYGPERVFGIDVYIAVAQEDISSDEVLPSSNIHPSYGVLLRTSLLHTSCSRAHGCIKMPGSIHTKLTGQNVLPNQGDLL